jgi:hypothetical protein
MKALAVLLLIILVVCLGYLAVTWAKTQLAKRQQADAEWELSERSDGEQVVVYVVKPGEERLLIGSVAFANPDFEYRIEELRSQARYKLVALNDRTLNR